jgi:hypothetical protein
VIVGSEDLTMAESASPFDLEFAKWFSHRGGAWSGTASELLVSLNTSVHADRESPMTFVGLYDHLQSHRQILRLLGVDVILRNGVPRTILLRSPQEQPQRTDPSIPSDAGRQSDPATVASSPTIAVEVVLPDETIAEVAGDESLNWDAFVANSDASARPSAGRPVQSDVFKEGFFSNTGEALFTIVEMRRQIKEQSLDLEATVDLVIGRAQEITKCYGIAVGFLPQEIGFQSRTGKHGSRNDLTFDANLFQSRLAAGEAVQITDAQKHPLIGATYRREGVGSLIIVPVFRNREVAGAIEFFFEEKRSFSAGDVMDLGLFAGVISESIGG